MKIDIMKNIIFETIDSFENSNNEVRNMNISDKDNKNDSNYPEVSISKDKNHTEKVKRNKISKSKIEKVKKVVISKSKNIGGKSNSDSNKTQIKSNKQIDKNISENEADLSNANENNNYLKFKIPNLFKSFREASNEDTNLINVSDNENGRFVLAVTNPDGLKSKHLTLENFLARNNVDAVIVSETHYAGRHKPFVSRAYYPFFKNRSRFKAACKGGIAVFLKKELAELKRQSKPLSAVRINSGSSGIGNDEEEQGAAGQKV